MFQWALSQLEKCGRKQIIMDRDDIDPYLERYYIAWPDSTQRERKDIPFNVFLHRFMQSDDPVYHDHPWEWYFTLILKGGYWEHTPWGTTWRGPGSWKYTNCIHEKEYGNVLIPANLHWVEIPEPGKTWTLFMRGKTKPGDWGFVPDPESGIWIQHEEYLNKFRRNREKTS